MESKYLMGASDEILRNPSRRAIPTDMSSDFRRSLLCLAIAETIESLKIFLELEQSTWNIEALADDYNRVFEKGRSLGLFRRGGIREKDHLSLWCVSKVYQPTIYIESGVFIGSSLHAALSAHPAQQSFAIDPNLTRLLLPDEDLANVQLVDDADFAQLDLRVAGQRVLAYFDDHIDTAKRIVSAADKGIGCLVFDDSTGMEGICQRVYPAIPTLPMIMNWEMLQVGQELEWTVRRTPHDSAWGCIKGLARRAVGRGFVRLSLTINEGTIESCRRAKGLIKKCMKLPDLGDFVPQTHPERTIDATKFLVLLNV